MPRKKNILTLKKKCQIKLRLIKLKNHEIGQDLEALREDIIAETEMKEDEADHQGEDQELQKEIGTDGIIENIEIKETDIMKDDITEDRDQGQDLDHHPDTKAVVNRI